MSDQRPHLKTLEEIERDCLPGLGEDKMGPDLADAMEEQSTRLGAEMRTDDVVRVYLSEPPFRLWAEGEEGPILARTVIVATGATPRWPGVEGEKRLFGRGVSGCATVDGFFFRAKRVAVVGGGDTAMQEAALHQKSGSDTRSGSLDLNKTHFL